MFILHVSDLWLRDYLFSLQDLGPSVGKNMVLTVPSWLDLQFNFRLVILKCFLLVSHSCYLYSMI